MSNLKQVILVRTDIKMSKGKTAAQVAHASVEAVFNTNKKLLSKWRQSGMKKITLKVESLEELKKYNSLALDQDIATGLIIDAGHTELDSGTITCLAIGPGPEIKIDKLTSHLKNL